VRSSKVEKNANRVKSEKHIDTKQEKRGYQRGQARKKNQGKSGQFQELVAALSDLAVVAGLRI